MTQEQPAQTTQTTPSAEPTLNDRISQLEQHPHLKADHTLQQQLGELKEEQAFYDYAATGSFQMPPNFKSPEEFWKSHKELQKLATQKSQEAAELRRQIESQQSAPAPQVTTTNDAGPEVTEVIETATQVTDNAELPSGAPRIEPPKEPDVVDVKTNPAPSIISDTEYTEMAAEVARTGSLSEEWMSKLRTKGLPEMAVRDFVSAQKAKAQQAWTEAISIAGSKETLFTVFEWAGKNLTKTALEKVNADLADPDKRETTLRGIISKYETTAPKTPKSAPQIAQKATKEPPRIPNASSPQSTPQGMDAPYRSIDEFYRDMDNPKFRSDPAFEQAVARRYAKSPFFRNS